MDHSFESVSLSRPQPEHERKLLLFDLCFDGHHPAYIRHIIRYWCEKGLLGSLDIVVSPQFLKRCPDIVDLALSKGQGNIHFKAITAQEEANLRPRTTGLNRNYRNLQEWQLLCQYAKHLRSTHCLLPYFDTSELPLVLGLRAPCPVSGIYFRPTFHYQHFTEYTPSRKEKFQQWKEKLFISRVLRHPNLHTLFCLDPFAVKYMAQLYRRGNMVHLPDPVELNGYQTTEHKPEHLEALKQRLGIEPDRKVFLLFGALTSRKGVYKLLQAIPLLPGTLCQKLCLVIVGEATAADHARIEAEIAAVAQENPVQIVRHYEFVAEQEVPSYFQMADIVLAVYQKHVGMSGILIQAAAAQKPVLSSNYGLMGEIVRRHSLGLAIDSTQPEEIAKGLSQFLLKPSEALGNPLQMKEFSEQNSTEKFADKLFSYL